MDLERLLGEFLGTDRGRPGDASSADEPSRAGRTRPGLSGALGEMLGDGRSGGGSIVDQIGGALKGRGGSALGGALAGGLASQLFKGKRLKKMGGTAVKLGGAAIVAGLAYKAYQSYQRKNAEPAAMPAPNPAPAGEIPSPEGTRFLPKGREEDHAGLMLSAIIAAAKADGYIDEAEEEAIFGRIDELGLDAEEKGFVMDEMRRPKSVSELAGKAVSEEQKMEVYTASVMAIDADHPAEKDYLARLADALGLPPELTKEIHTTASEVQA